MAEVAARDAVARVVPPPSVEFASCGIAVTVDGAAADPRAMVCVATKGLDLGAHVTHQIDAAMLTAADRVYALDRSVLTRLLDIAPADTARRLALLSSLIPDAGVIDIDDPYSGTSADYEAAYALIRRAVDALAIALATGRCD